MQFNLSPALYMYVCHNTNAHSTTGHEYAMQHSVPRFDEHVNNRHPAECNIPLTSPHGSQPLLLTIIQHYPDQNDTRPATYSSRRNSHYRQRLLYRSLDVHQTARRVSRYCSRKLTISVVERIPSYMPYMLPVLHTCIHHITKPIYPPNREAYRGPEAYRRLQ